MSWRHSQRLEGLVAPAASYRPSKPVTTSHGDRVSIMATQGSTRYRRSGSIKCTACAWVPCNRLSGEAHWYSCEAAVPTPCDAEIKRMRRPDSLQHLTDPT